MARNPIVFNNGTLVSNAKVEIDGVIYDVTPAQYEGTTPLSASNLNQLQTNLYDYVDEEIENMIDVYSTEEIKTNKIYIDENNNKYHVYRRVLRGNTGTSTNWVNLGNIPNLLRIVDIRGIISSSGIDYPLNLNINSTYFVNLRNNNGVIQFNHGNEVNNRDIEVTIEYTKNN